MNESMNERTETNSQSGKYSKWRFFFEEVFVNEKVDEFFKRRFFLEVIIHSFINYIGC
jgi:hypothetical protein